MKVCASLLVAVAFALAGPLAMAQSASPATDKIDANAVDNSKTAPDQTPPPAPQPDAAPPPPQADQPAKPNESAAKPEDAAEPAKPVEPTPAGPTEPVKQDEALAIMGKKVVGPDGKEVLGAIIDLLIDKDGKPRAAIIDFGGFLGVGSRHVAVDWDTLKFVSGDHGISVRLAMDPAAIKAAPEYKDANPETEVVEPKPEDLPPVAPLTEPALSEEQIPILPPLQTSKNAGQ